ncbi:hypothetical protein ACFX2I_000650 [Malus domestica]
MSSRCKHNHRVHRLQYLAPAAVGRRLSGSHSPIVIYSPLSVGPRVFVAATCASFCVEAMRAPDNPDAMRWGLKRGR